jgi:hypothetical protein
MRSWKKWSIMLLLIGLTGWFIYALAFNWLMPKTAAFAVPGKWNRIPLRESKAIVHGYLGEPANSSRGMEEWIRKNGANKQFSLRIYYLADTLATAYSVRFHFKSRLVNRSYLIDSASIR